MGRGSVDLLYPLGHAIAALYLSAVSGIWYFGDSMVETLSRRTICLRLENPSPAPPRDWLYTRVSNHGRPSHLSPIHHANY